jgi:hypothetical protein
MPIAIPLWIIGWTLTFFATKQKPTLAKAPKPQTLHFMVLPQEQALHPLQQAQQH